ncbi:uncharacterized protein LOC141652718 [Silene latifolia]|uniref:uncharacterized protein LOC141652718 n=1 Tax=Silene latifolia TaxID=37657 RepID=UPI003D779EF4
MAEEPSPPSPELTEQQKLIIEANRARALAKRKAFLSSQQQQQQQQQQHFQNPDLNPHWRQFKCRKLIDNSNSIPKQDTLLPSKFRVRLEICAPDSFSITPYSIPGVSFPGQDHCFSVLNDCLSNVSLLHYTQLHGGGDASVYKLRDYEAVVKCLKNYKDIEVEEIPWTTYNVVAKLFHSFNMGRWLPCRPEHLPDEKVEELMHKLPRKLLTTLLPFQHEGLKFGLQRGGRCLIADEMGLGKTLQAIAIASCFSDEGSILVVCPAILRYTWAEELERWLPSYLPADIHLVFGRQNNPVHLKRCPKIVVISYTMLHRLRESMLQLKWAVLIIDESHHIRCSKKKSEPGEIKAVLDVASQTKRIILLSGTPSLSRPFDIFHQIDMLWPGLLGKNKFDFAKTYCSMKLMKDSQGNSFMDFSRGTRLEELNVLLRQTVMIRRLKEHLLVQLPPKRRQIIMLTLKKSDVTFARNVVAAQGEPLSTIDACEEDDEYGNGTRRCQEELSDQVLGIAKVSGALEWLSLHPIFTEADDSVNVEVDASSHKMIIFAHHLKVLDKLQGFLCNKGVGFVRIDGNVLDCDRQSAVKSFQSSKEVKIAIIGIQVGYAGLDLSVAHNVVFLELPKDPTSLQQAEDRAHRRGQTKAVNIYIFCAKDTSDESRWRRLNNSVQRVSSTVDGKYDAIRGFAVDNVSHLGKTNVCQGVNFDNAGPLSEEHDKDDNLPLGTADCCADDKDADKFDVANKLTNDKSDHMTQDQRDIQAKIDTLRFAVSQYTGRIHLCTCEDGDDARVTSLSENFRLEEVTVDSIEKESDLVKKNSGFHYAMLSFIKEWTSLKRMDQKKLFGKPLQLPLAIELLRLTESMGHDRNGLLKGGSKRRHTPVCDISYPLRLNAVVKDVCICDARKKKKVYMQFWTLADEPLCKLCQNPCSGVNAKKPKDFLDLFCSLACYGDYRSRTSGSFLRQELFEVERGVCTNCNLDCHKLVQYLKPLSKEDREKYIEREAPQLTKHKKLHDKLVSEPTEGNAWHADHKIAVFLGGGECKVENMRTLCVACHADVTAAQHAERCSARKKLRKATTDIKNSRKKLKEHGLPASEDKREDDDLLIDVPGSSYSEVKADDGGIKLPESSCNE